MSIISNRLPFIRYREINRQTKGFYLIMNTIHEITIVCVRDDTYEAETALQHSLFRNFDVCGRAILFV